MAVPGRKISDFHGSAPDFQGRESHGSSSDFHDSLSHGSTSDSQGSVPQGSVSHGSDEVFNHKCEPCLTDGQHLEAYGYCVDCKEYLCNNCFKYHQRTRALKHHQLLDKDNIDKLDMTVKPQETFTEKCEIHKNEIIKFFCPKHDVLGCGDCITMNHRVCDIDYIPDKCAGIRDSAEYKDVMKELEQKLVEADAVVKKANEKDSMIDTCHEKANQDMDKFQIEIIQLISEQHKQIKTEADARKSEDKQKIQNVLTSCSEICLNINQLKANIDDSKANNQNGQMFIAIKRAKSKLKSDVLKQDHDSLEKTNVEYTFKHNNELKGMLSKSGVFGHLISSKNTGNVRMPDDSQRGNSKTFDLKDTDNSNWAHFTPKRKGEDSKMSYDSKSKDTGNSKWAYLSPKRKGEDSEMSFDSNAKDTDNLNWANFSSEKKRDDSKMTYDSNSRDPDNLDNWAHFSSEKKRDDSKMPHDSNFRDTGNFNWAHFSSEKKRDDSKMSYDSNTRNTDDFNWAHFSSEKRKDDSKMYYDSNSTDTDNFNWANFSSAKKSDDSKMSYDSKSKDTSNSKMTNKTSTMKTGKTKMSFDTHTKKTVNIEKSYDSQSKDTATPKSTGYNESKKKGATKAIPKPAQPHTLSYKGFINVKTETDLETCGISACAILSSERLILADTVNMKLKIVETKGCTSTVIDEKILESSPKDLAVLPKDETAVTIPDKKKILVVTTAGQLSIKNTIHVEGVCRGITYNQDCLYVICWFPYCVFVLQMSGKIKNAISLSSASLSPHYIVFNPVFEVIYVSDMGKHSIRSLTLEGDVSAVYANRGLKPVGMVMLDDGSLLVCNQFNNTVHCVSGDLKQNWQVINDLKSWKPLSICYRGDRNEVYIGASNSDQLKTFTLL